MKGKEWGREKGKDIGSTSAVRDKQIALRKPHQVNVQTTTE